MSLGERIRIFRQKKGLSAKELAQRIEVSSGMISKIEHDVSNPSLDVLRKIAMELHVSVGDLVSHEPSSQNSELFETNNRHKRVSVVRVNERKQLRLPKSGIIYQVLTPDFRGKAEIVLVELTPGEGGSEYIHHDQGEEYAFVLEGVLTVCIEDQEFILFTGDCITFDARQSHRYVNNGEDKVVWISIAVPPNL